MTNIYTDGNYLKNAPTWHIEDSHWKSQQIKKILIKNEINPKTICEVGCGAGEILNQLYKTYSSEVSYIGFEISPQAYELCKKIENNKIQYYLDDFCQVENSFFDVILLIDVIEHIEDMFTFLRKIKYKGEYKIFHIPLEICAVNLIKSKTLSTGLVHPGHIHFFTKDIALEILRISGYKILDYFYTPTFKMKVGDNILQTKLLKIARKHAYNLNKDFGLRIFGGVSLLVLTK